MITIYHVPSSRSQRIVWLMEEMQEAYRLESFGIPVPESFLEINPLGSVPTIVETMRMNRSPCSKASA